MKTVSMHARPRATRALRRLAFGGSFAALVWLGAVSVAPLVARADEQQAASPSTASALPPEEVERQAEAISRSIMSPFCPGRTVSACPVAGPWRDDIRRWVGEGVDAEEIKRRLAERAPEHNLMGVPKNRLGWALPVGLGVLALGTLIFLLRYLVGPRAGTGSAGDKKPAASDAPSAEPKAADAQAVDVKAAEPKAAEAPRVKANAAVASRANGEDYDARLEQELDRLE